MSTKFQEKVWRLIEKIPPGRVSTYQEVARALGMPGASRAVGGALHRNPRAPVVPCHRIVKSDGRLGGYAGGLDKKTYLLEKEGIKVQDERIIGFESIMFRLLKKKREIRIKR